MDGCGAGDALGNGLVNDHQKLLYQYSGQPEADTLQFGTTLDYTIINHELMNVQTPHSWVQQPASSLQFGTPPNHAVLNSRSMNVQPPQLAQQPDPPVADTFQFGTPPNRAILNPGSMKVQPPQLAQQRVGTFQFGTPPNYAVLNSGSMNVQPPQLVQQPGAVNNVNPSISTQMNSFPLAERGTSQSSNITNANAEKAARIRESKKRSREKKEKENRDNAEKVVELATENGVLSEANAVLLEANASLEKARDEAIIKQQDAQQELRSFREEVNLQARQLETLSEILVITPEVIAAAKENEQLKRKIELLTTNNPDIIKTVELQEENEKLKRELKKLSFINDALFGKLSKDEQ